jgi:hypothetical protein
MAKLTIQNIPDWLCLAQAHAEEVCKLGQGPATCRYLTLGENGWFCAKLDKKLKGDIDRQQETFMAKGDNCDGIRMISAKLVNNN